MFKKIIRVTLAIFLLLVLAVGGLLLYLYNNQDQVAGLVLRELNDMQRGHTTLRRVYINPYKDFPYVSVDLNGLALYESAKDTTKPIYRFEDVYVGFNIWNILEGDYDIKRITVRNGKLNLIKHADGTYNLLLAKSPRQKAAETGGKVHLKLRRITLENVTVEKTDSVSNQYTHLHIAKAVTGFSYVNDVIDNHIESEMTLREFRSAGSVIFSNKHLRIISDVSFDANKNFLTIRPSDFIIEQAAFGLSGTIDLARNAYLDLSVAGRKPDFKLLTAFAPEYVYQRLRSYQNRGDVFFKGKITGPAIDDMPRIDLAFGCKNAQFINPSASNSIRDLNFTGFYTNGDKRSLETSELRIQSLSGKPEESLFKGSFHIKNFINPYISVDFHSRLNLATLRNFFEIESLKTLSGWLTIDMTVDELLDYNDVPMTLGKLKDGTDSRLLLENVRFQPDGYPHAIEQVNGRMELAAGTLILKALRGKIGNSDFEVSGDISNLASYFHKKDADVTANLRGKSLFLDLRQLLGFDKKLAASVDDQMRDLSFGFAFQTSVKNLREPGRGLPEGRFTVSDLTCKLKNYPHTIHDTHVDIAVTKRDLLIKLLETELDRSDFHATGHFKNYHTFMDSTAVEPFELQLAARADHIEFRDLFTYKNTNHLPAEYRNEVAENLHLDMTTTGQANDWRKGNVLKDSRLTLRRLDGVLRVHPVKLRDIAGDFTAQNGNLAIRDFHARLGSSDFRVSGTIEDVANAATMQSKKVLSFQSKNLNLDEMWFNQPEPQPANTGVTQIVSTNHPKPNAHDDAPNVFKIKFPDLTLHVDIGRLNYQKFLLKNLKGTARTTKQRHLYFDNLRLETAGGQVGLNGYFNGSNPERIYFTGDVKLDKLDLDRIFYKFDNFGQDYLVNNNLHGKLSGHVKCNVRMHPDFTPDLQDTEMHLDATVTDGRMTNFAPFQAMSAFMGDKDLENVRFGELKNAFDFKNGTLQIPKMEVATNLGYIHVAGRQQMDLQMNYDLQIPVRLVKEATWSYLTRRRRERQETQAATQEEDAVVDEIVTAKESNDRRFINVNVSGTPSDYKIRLGKRRKAEK